MNYLGEFHSNRVIVCRAGIGRLSLVPQCTAQLAAFETVQRRRQREDIACRGTEIRRRRLGSASARLRADRIVARVPRYRKRFIATRSPVSTHPSRVALPPL